MHTGDQDGQHIELPRVVQEQRPAGHEYEYGQADQDCRSRANPVADAAKHDRRRKRHELHQQYGLDQRRLWQANVASNLHRQLLQGADSVDVQPIGEQEAEHQRIADDLAQRSAQLCPARRFRGRRRLGNAPEQRQSE